MATRRPLVHNGTGAGQELPTTDTLPIGALPAEVVTDTELTAALDPYQKIHVGTTAPSNPAVGDLWVDTT